LSGELTVPDNIVLTGTPDESGDETSMLRLALDKLSIGYAVLDNDLRYQFFNERYVELLKCNPGDIEPGRSAMEVLQGMVDNGFFGKSNADEIIQFRISELRSDKPLERDFEDKDGTFIRLSIFPLSSGSVMVTLTDIGVEKTAEREKAVTEDRLRRALDNIEGAVLMYDKDLILQVYSSRYLEIGGLPEELFVVGESIFPVLLYRAERGDYGEGDPKQLADQRAEYLKNVPDNLYQEQPMGKGIAEVFWSRDDQGNLVSVTNDITRRKETELMLEEARLEAQAANKAKSEFLANMSHELRTPLNAVIGFSDSMLAGLTGELNERQKEYVQDISNSGAHLLALINDVLDLSKIEAGKAAVEESLFFVSDVIEDSLSLVREAAMSSEISLNSDGVAREIGVRADIRMMKQIVVNLLSNAVKFTPEGGCVTTSLDRRKDGDLLISVSDTGYGMRPEEIPQALKEFEQTDTGRERGGTGLGLPLTKSMIELHGGNLSIISAPGKGTTAIFSIPHYRVAEVPRKL
jgi:signal transduction histidine kinase